MGKTCLEADKQSAENDINFNKACAAFNPLIRFNSDTIFEPRGTESQKGNGRIISKRLLFDSFPGVSFFDPRDNVLFLRILAWLVWMFMLPFILWSTTAPPSWLPVAIKARWYELCYYLHAVGAWVTVILALYARFEVFFPIMIGWSLLFFEFLREGFFHTWSLTLVVDATAAAFRADGEYESRLPTRIYEDRKTKRPTAIALQFKKPESFSPGSGQWVYLKCKEIDNIWHPFSLASSSADKKLMLQIGIRGNWPKKPPASGKQWTMPAASATWTYSLLEKVRELQEASEQQDEAQSMPVQVRGPYGSPFTKLCEHPYPAAVLIGAGTGLTSTLSVLKEILKRRSLGLPTPRFLWFVWSCRAEDDIEWCWRALQDAINDAWKWGGLQCGADWSPLTSSMMDWLSVTIYVSRTTKKTLHAFLNEAHMNTSTQEEIYSAPHGKGKGKARGLTFTKGKTPPLVNNASHASASASSSAPAPAQAWGSGSGSAPAPAPAPAWAPGLASAPAAGPAEPFKGIMRMTSDDPLGYPLVSESSDDSDDDDFDYGDDFVDMATVNLPQLNTVQQTSFPSKGHGYQHDNDDQFMQRDSSTSSYQDDGVREHPNFKRVFTVTSSRKVGGGGGGGSAAHASGGPQTHAGTPKTGTMTEWKEFLATLHQVPDRTTAIPVVSSSDDSESDDDDDNFRRGAAGVPRTRTGDYVNREAINTAELEYENGGDAHSHHISALSTHAADGSLLSAGNQLQQAVQVEPVPRFESGVQERELLGKVEVNHEIGYQLATATSGAMPTHANTPLPTPALTPMPTPMPAMQPPPTNPGPADADAKARRNAKAKGLRSQRRRKAHMAKKIRSWIADQVITTSMDDPVAPIGRLLKWVHKTTNESILAGDQHGKISVSFCGPPAMGAMLEETVSNLGLEYNAHTQ